MHHFPCTPDCPIDVYADWLEDQGIDPAGVRLLAAGWCFADFSNWTFRSSYGMDMTHDHGYGYYLAYGNGRDFHFDHFYMSRFGDGYINW